MKKSKRNKIVEIFDRETGEPKGYIPAYYTPVPDEFILNHLSHLKRNEIKVMLAIFYKTFGFKKYEDFISLNQISRICKLGKSNISRAIRKLNEKKLIEVFDLIKEGSKEARKIRIKILPLDELISSKSEGLSK